MSSTHCRRGEIWLADFNPGRGSEQKGIRPALIIQNDIGNEHSATTIVAAVTTKLRQFPVTVFLPAKEGGLRASSIVNLAHILTLDKARLVKKLGALSPDRVRQVDEAIRISLGVEI